MIKLHLPTSILLLAVTFLAASAQTPDFSGIKLVIDPGHGGHESDDRGMPNGFWESESNLTKALWLAALLEERGCEVLLTRYGNSEEEVDDPSLSARPQIAIENGADMFLSIHSNAGNQVSNYPMTIFNGKTASPTVPASKDWAVVLWEQLKTNQGTYWTSEGKAIGDLTLNPTWTTGYGVLVPLNKSKICGIISEGSFHDYQPEMDRLLNLDYRKQEAWNMLYALITYFNIEGTETHGNISGIVRDSLLEKDFFSLPDAADAYENVNGAVVELLENGEIYRVDSLNTGFYMFGSIVPGDYHLVFSASGYFNDTVNVTVTAHQFSYVNQWMEADKTMPPKILGYGPADTNPTPCFDPVTLRFNMNMDSASVAEAFSINPEIPGSFSWDKKHLNVSFQPDLPYETETRYTVELDSTATHQWGVKLDSSLSFSFTTDKRNRYLVESTYPAESESAVSPYPQFRVIFETPVNNTSLIGAVSIKAADGTLLSTKGADISTVDDKGHYYFSASEDLAYDTDYTLILEGSIKDETNIPMVEKYEISFHTMNDPGVITILDEMEDTDQWSIDMASSQGIDDLTFLYRWKKTLISGNASMLLRYNFLSLDAICSFKPEEAIALDPRLSHTGIWIWGELSGHHMVMGFNDGSEVELGSIDFAGWAYRSIEIPEGATAITYLKLIRENDTVNMGDLIFDVLHQPGSTVDVENPQLEGISVYPNPIKNSEIRISGLPQLYSDYALFSLSGKMLQSGILLPGESSISLESGARGANALILKVKNKTGSFETLLLTQ